MLLTILRSGVLPMAFVIIFNPLIDNFVEVLTKKFFGHRD